MADTQNKRKFDDSGSNVSYNRVPPPMSDFELAKQKAMQIAARLTAQDSTTKRSRFDDRISDGAAQPDDSSSVGNDVSSHYYGNFTQAKVVEKTYNDAPSGAGGFYNMNTAPESRKVEIPNIKVGLVIGKGGETIKYIQQQSGAKIQITKDMDHNPNLPSRTVELMGTPEQISRAEQLIHDVIAEADAAAANTTHASAGEQIQMNVPTNKVGLIIGRGGETIKSLQSRTGARIQLVPLMGPPDGVTERVLTIVGSKQQIDAATECINDLISENRVRAPSVQGGYNQAYNTTQAPQQWAPPPAPPLQQQGYGYQQGYQQQHQGSYYPGAPQSYGSYPQQTSTGWNQVPPGPPQQFHPPGAYGYYNQQQVPMPYPPQVGGYDQAAPYAEHPPGAPQESYESHQNYGAPGLPAYGQPGTAYSHMPPHEGYGPPGVGDPGYGQQVASQSQQELPGVTQPDYRYQNQESQEQQSSKQSLEYGYDQSNGTSYEHPEASHSLYGQSGPTQHGSDQGGEATGQANYGQPATGYWNQQYNYGGYQSAETSYGEQVPQQPGYGVPSYEQQDPQLPDSQQMYSGHGATGGYDGTAEQQPNDPKKAEFQHESYGREHHQNSQGQYSQATGQDYDGQYNSEYKDGSGNRGNDGETEVVNSRSKEASTDEDNEHQS